MEHPIHSVNGFKRVDTYVLRVEFQDGTHQVIDFEPVLHGELLGMLRDPGEFAKVWLDEEAGTLVWPSGADFDPAMLHDWPEIVEEFTKLARSWDEVPVRDR